MGGTDWSQEAMSVQLTLELPEEVYQRVRQTAVRARRPVLTLLTDALSATFPPVEDLPPEIAGEVALFTARGDEVLVDIAKEVLPEEEQVALNRLLDRNSEGNLTDEEEAELNTLMDTYWRVTLRKAQARAILAQRRQQRGEGSSREF
jgi:hypothetical protein